MSKKTSHGVGVSLPDDPDQLLDSGQAAKVLGLSKHYILAHLKKTKPTIPHIRIAANCVRFRREDLKEFAASLAKKN